MKTYKSLILFVFCSVTSTFASDVLAKFKVVYSDKGNNGLKWSSVIGRSTNYSNKIITLPNGKKSVGDDSLAVQACAHAGGRLPSINEYKAMKRDFSTEEQMQTTFGDMGAMNVYWTSTPSQFTHGHAFAFWGNGATDYFYSGANGFLVRCVGR